MSELRAASEIVPEMVHRRRPLLGGRQRAYLTGSIYMLQVYDRVLASGSTATLVAISVIVLAAFMLQGAVDMFRMRMLARIGARFNELLAARVFHLTAVLPLKGGRAGVHMPRSATSTRSVDFCPGSVRPPCSTCPSCRCFSSSASCSTLAWHPHHLRGDRHHRCSRSSPSDGAGAVAQACGGSVHSAML